MHDTLDRDRLHVTVDILILTVRAGRLGLLLARRPSPPFAGRWALPGRFVGLEESAEQTVAGLLAEMLPVEDTYVEQLYTFTEVDRDPRGRVISAAYLAAVPWEGLRDVLTRPEVKLRCFDVKLDDAGLRLEGDDGLVLAGADMAFDHGRIVETGVTRLRGKIDYTDIAFHFLDDTDAFPLSALLTVYEAVLDRDIDNSNFRRAVRSRYEETGRVVQTDREMRFRRGRPAALYRLVKPEQEALS